MTSFHLIIQRLMTMLIVSIKFYLLQGYFRYIDLQIEINSENETLLQKR
jgi:hypothetical protein